MSINYENTLLDISNLNKNHHPQLKLVNQNSFIVGVLLVLSFTTSCNKHYNAPVFVPAPDQYSPKGPITHLYAFEPNNIFYQSDVIQITAKNGLIDTLPNGFREYRITPTAKGVVKVKVTYKKTDKSKNIDTVTKTLRFKATTHPNILIKLDTTKLKDSLDIHYELVYENTLKPINFKRYHVGALPADIIVYHESTMVGEIPFYFDDQEIKEVLEKGNIMCHPGFIIRDVKTDLYFQAYEICYKYK
jgi:hypothetical protein